MSFYEDTSCRMYYCYVSKSGTFRYICVEKYSQSFARSLARSQNSRDARMPGDIACISDLNYKSRSPIIDALDRNASFRLFFARRNYFHPAFRIARSTSEYNRTRETNRTVSIEYRERTRRYIDDKNSRGLARKSNTRVQRRARFARTGNTVDSASARFIIEHHGRITLECSCSLSGIDVVQRRFDESHQPNRKSRLEDGSRLRDDAPFAAEIPAT